MKISKNFRVEEFAVSASFPYLVVPVPLQLQRNVISLVLAVLQPICDETGWRDYISSGYRSDALNKAVGGSPTSDHRFGRAADNNFYRTIAGRREEVAPIEVARVVQSLGLEYDQMILYPTFVHMGYRLGENRHMLLYHTTYRGKRL